MVEVEPFPKSQLHDVAPPVDLSENTTTSGEHPDWTFEVKSAFTWLKLLLQTNAKTLNSKPEHKRVLVFIENWFFELGMDFVFLFAGKC